jgi:peptidoglycan-N-acetylglucosamine deacetylase
VKPTVCLTFDFDAISLWLARGATTPGPVSRGEFGAFAIPRILELLRRHDIRSTFFIPAHTLQSYPGQCSAIAEAGHELALHGDRHEPVSTLDRAQELAANLRGVEQIRRLTGAAPRGHRTPSFDFTPNTVDILTEIGVDYDSSLMGADSTAYFVRSGDRDEPGEAYRFGPQTSVVELPVSWTLDDYPHLEFHRAPGTVMPGLQSPRVMFENFLADVRYLTERVRDGFLVVTLHPQVIGRGGRMLELERFIERVSALGARFDRCDDVATRARGELGAGAR